MKIFKYGAIITLFIGVMTGCIGLNPNTITDDTVTDETTSDKLQSYQNYLQEVRMMDQIFNEIVTTDRLEYMTYIKQTSTSDWLDDLNLQKSNLGTLIDVADIKFGIANDNGYYVVVNSMGYSGTNPANPIDVNRPLPEDYFGVYYSVDGSVWDRVAPFDQIVYLASCPIDTNIMYLSLVTEQGGGSWEMYVETYSSSDAGYTWSRIEDTKFLTTNPYNISFVDDEFIDGEACRTAYAYDSEPGTWQLLSAPLTE